MLRRSNELATECAERGISLDASKKYTRQDMVDLLAQKTLSDREAAGELVSWGLRRRVSYQSPMLCFSYKHLKPSQKKEVLGSPNWIAEQKYDGARMWITYHPDEGFKFFSRNVSVLDYLPVEFTDRILLIKDGLVKKPSDFVGAFKRSFILDSEVLCPNARVDTSLYRSNGVQTGSELNAVTAILAIGVDASHKIQVEQNAPLEFACFDVIEFDEKPVWKSVLAKRKVLLSKILEKLNPILPFYESKYVVEGKKEFYEDLIARGFEGVVLKNLNEPYIPTTSRPRVAQVKLKRSMSEALGSDVDAFVCGYVASSKDKSWGHLIGALKMAVILRDSDGVEKEHWIGSVGSMPLVTREQMTELGPDGQPRLKREFYGKVLVINGQDVSSRAFRFMHCTADWARGFRTDKSKIDCVMDKEFLESQVL